MTPVQIIQNLKGIFGSKGEHEPSADLERIAGMTMASEAARRQTAS
jgi:hypothetical protein